MLSYAHDGLPLYIHNDAGSFYHILHSTDKMRRLADAAAACDPKVVLDVGANSGIFGAFVKQMCPDVRLYLFEPAPELAPVIERNLSRFGDYELVRRAVADASGRRMLYVNRHSQQTNSLLESSVAPLLVQSQRPEEIEVDSMTLDDFVAERGLDSIDLLKVDIQGAEHLLLRGATSTLRLTRFALFEISFMFEGVFETLDTLRAHFPHARLVNPVQMGADILFWR